MKINNRKPHLNGIGKTEGGALKPYHLSSVADPTEKDLPCKSPCRSQNFTTLAEKERFFFCPSNSLANETVTTQPMKRYYILNSLFTPVDFLFVTALLTSPFPSIKGHSLFSTLAFGFAIVCLSRIVVLRYSRMNAFLQEN